MKKKPNDPFGADVLDVLDKLAEHAKAARGNLADIQRRFAALTGKQVGHVTMLRWLRENRDERVEPLLGAGLALIEVWRQIDAERGENSLQAAAKKLLEDFVSIPRPLNLETTEHRLIFAIKRVRDAQPCAYLERRFKVKGSK